MHWDKPKNFSINAVLKKAQKKDTNEKIQKIIIPVKVELKSIYEIWQIELNSIVYILFKI